MDLFAEEGLMYFGIEKKVKEVGPTELVVLEIFDVIKDKLNKGTEITKQEVIALAFTPIMGGSMSEQEKILKAIRMTMTIDKEYSMMFNLFYMRLQINF